MSRGGLPAVFASGLMLVACGSGAAPVPTPPDCATVPARGSIIAEACYTDCAVGLVDPVDHVALVLRFGGDSSLTPVLTRCGLGGGGCVSGSLETPGIPSLGGVVTAVVDVASAKLFVLVDVPSGYQTGGVLRCELDGTNCDFIYLPSNATFDTPGARPVIDDASGQLLVLAHEGLVRCKLDLSSCAFADISAGAGAGALMGMALAIDPIHAKLLVVGEDQSASSDVVLLRCAIDGSNCRETDLSAGISPASPPFVAAPPLVDAADQKLLVPTQTIDAPHAHLLRCDLDGTGCALVDISAGHDGFVGSAIIDPAHQSLLAMTTQCSFRACWPGILHCALDGTGCAYLDVLQSALADDPTPFLDPTSDTLYVIGSGRDSNRVPFEVALWSLGLCW